MIKILTFCFLALWSFDHVHATEVNTKKIVKTDRGGNAKVSVSFTNSSKEQVLVKVKFNLADGWNIYAPFEEKNDGFIEVFEPKFDFKNSKNFLYTKTIWPKFETKNDEFDHNIKYNIYKKEAVIFITAKATDQDSQREVNMNLKFALCNKICIMEEMDFNGIITSNFVDKEVIQEFTQSSTKNGNFTTKTQNIFLILLISFLGGLILNIMPCIFPILSLKIFSIASKQSTRLDLISISSGIVFSFFVFSIITIILKYFGQQVGWGFQFQNPYFVTFIICVLTIFMANLLSLIEFKFNWITDFGNNLSQKNLKGNETDRTIRIGASFISGIISAIFAMPCSAPFVGIAISFALSNSFYEIILIFLSMGLGMSFPYIILAIFPKIIATLPRSGSWVYKAKSVIGILLFPAIIWMVYNLYGIIGKLAIYILIIYLAIFAIFRLNSMKKLKPWVVLILISASFYLPSLDKSQSSIKNNDFWIEFDEESIKKYLNEDRVVFIDVTARWCITCKFNKIRVLEDAEIKKILDSNKVVAMRADITKENSEITNYIRKYNRYAIPFNIIYTKKYPNGILLPEILNKKEILNLIEIEK